MGVQTNRIAVWPTGALSQPDAGHTPQPGSLKRRDRTLVEPMSDFCLIPFDTELLSLLRSFFYTPSHCDIRGPFFYVDHFDHQHALCTERACNNNRLVAGQG